MEVLVATVAAFLFSGAYYGLAGDRAGTPAGPAAESMPLQVGAELLRSGVVAAVLAVYATRMDAEGVADGLALGGSAWLAFPLMLLAGSVLHEGVAPRLAALHAGDWLGKLLLIGVIVTVAG